MTTITHEPIPGWEVKAEPPDQRALDLEQLQAAFARACADPVDGKAQEDFRAAYAAFYERYLKE